MRRSSRRTDLGAAARAGGRWRAGLLGALLAAVLSCGPRPTSESAGRGVLVFVIDGLRADHLSALGYDRPTTPTLDELWKRGAIFENAWAASPDLVAAHAALLTGCDPWLARRPGVHGTRQEVELLGWFLPDSIPRVAQEFLARGFETAAFIDHPAVSEVRGFARGFQTFSGFREEAVETTMDFGFEAVASKFLHWVTARSHEADWFAYLEIDDLERLWQRGNPDPAWDSFFAARPGMSHVPPVVEGDPVFFGIPRSRWSGATLSIGEYEARYDGALRQLDGRLKRLLTQLRKSGRLENTTIAIVGSFGMSFGESGVYLAAGTLSDVDLRVPWIVRPSPAIDCQRGVRTSAVASTIDFAPTLLDLLGFGVPPSMQGVSQAGAMRGAGPPARTIAFASGGLSPGIAAFDEHLCWTATRPVVDDGLLSLSWSGEAGAASAGERIVVHDRRVDGDRGHLSSDIPDVRVADALALAAREWFAWTESAARVLHAQGGMRAEDAQVVEDLRRRGYQLPALR